MCFEEVACMGCMDLRNLFRSAEISVACMATEFHGDGAIAVLDDYGSC